MNSVTVTVHGANDLAQKLDEIDSLVVTLRRKLAELNEGCLQLEMTLAKTAPTEHREPYGQHIKE